MRAPEPHHDSTAATAGWSPTLPEAPGFEHFVVETPGLRTHVATIGDGEPVVLLHGFPLHWWQWHADAGKLLPDDAPDAVANLTLDWIQQAD